MEDHNGAPEIPKELERGVVVMFEQFFTVTVFSKTSVNGLSTPRQINYELTPRQVKAYIKQTDSHDPSRYDLYNAIGERLIDDTPLSGQRITAGGYIIAKPKIFCPLN
ncbi:hypothetical protein ABPG77_006004 [Micractinium sp. CCAP 211/92]